MTVKELAISYGFTPLDEEIEIGDSVFACGPSRKPALLIVKDFGEEKSFIIPVEKNIYWYNIMDCVKIKEN